MPKLAGSPARKSTVLAVVIILLVLASFSVFLTLNQSERTVHSSSGAVISLEGYAFRPGSVRYDLMSGTAGRLLAKLLPDAAKKRIRWFRPEQTCYVDNDFPKEALLSAAFSSRDASGRIQGVGTRLIVSDDHGQSFDGVMNCPGNGGVFWATAFPRRSVRLRLRLMDGDVSLAEFTIPNPCPGPHPVWRPEQIPVTATNKGVAVTLESFVSDAARLRTSCVLRVREEGTQSSAWQPQAFEMLDATGNHWRPIVGGPSTNVNGVIRMHFLGALWPEENAWKLRLKLTPAEEKSGDRTAFAVEFLAKPDQVNGDQALPETKRLDEH